MRNSTAPAVMQDWIQNAQSDERQPPVSEFTMDLIEGYARNAERIDELIATYSVGWTLDRMPAVDRCILRLAAYELIWSEDVPEAVVIDEALDIAREFSTDDSPQFINGLLGRLQSLKPTLRR